MKKIELVNASGSPDEDVKRTLETSNSAQLALEVATFIGNTLKITTVISNTHDGLYMVDFAINGNLQPTVRIDGQKVIWPSGSNADLVQKYLDQLFKY